MKINGKYNLRIKNPANPLIEKNNKKKEIVYYVGLDACLAYYNVHGSIDDIGEPIHEIKNKILEWISKGIKIKIFTARAYCEKNIKHIRKWLLVNGFPPNLEITNIKGLDCDLIFDNNAREVIDNTGIIVDRTGKFNINKLDK